MIGILFATALLGFAGQPPRAGTWVQGVVYERAGEAIRPLPRAFVSISSGGELLGTLRTDDQGRYRFLELPAGRLTLAASKPGYLTRQAAGRAGSQAILDCSKGCRQSGMDFELSRGAVVAGVVSDARRQPIARAAIFLQRTGSSGSSEKPSIGATDDRGRFRVAGLAAGPYSLTVQRRGPGAQDEVRTKALQVGEGEQMVDLALVIGSEGSFRVAGRVSGIPFGEGYQTGVAIRPLNRSMPGSARALQATVGPDGRFQFDSVPAGRYAASAAVVKLESAERSDHSLQVLEVLGDTEVALQPIELATVAGPVEVAAGTLPPGAIIRFTSQEGFGYNWTRVSGAGQQLDLKGLRPGIYRVETDSAQFYIKGVKSGGEIESPERVTLSPGVNRLTVVTAADHSRVLGMVRDPKSSQPLPQARVALHGQRGQYSVQSDQAGRFLFGKVIPGEYRICAWANIEPERLQDEAGWEKAGCQSRIIPIDPSSEVEIDLRAAP